MIDMIEQTTAAGLSGTTAKSAKGGKQAGNGLFAKLMVILDKAEKQGGKSTLLKLAKPSATSPSESLNTTAQKLLLSTKKAEKLIDNVDGSKAQAIAVQAPVSHSPLITSTVSIIINGNDKTGTKQAIAGTGNAEGKDSKTALFTKDIDANTSLLANKKEAINSGTKEAKKQASASIIQPGNGAEDSAEGTRSAGSKATVTKVTTNNQAVVANAKQQEGVTHPATGSEQVSGTLAAETGRRESLNRTTKAANKNTATTVQEGGKQKKGAESPNLLAAHISTLQNHTSASINQGNSSPATASAIMQQTSTDAGQQGTDKGSQDGRGFQVIAADQRASTAPVNQTSFQQYLNHKPTPTMTMFDTIEHITQAAKIGQTKLEIQLDPANLGRIHISLQTDASKQLQIHMIVDQSATRTAIDQQLPALKHALAQQGLDLSGFSMGSNGDQASSGFAGNESNGNQQSAFNNNNDINTSNSALQQQAATKSGSGLSIHV